MIKTHFIGPLSWADKAHSSLLLLRSWNIQSFFSTKLCMQLLRSFCISNDVLLWIIKFTEREKTKWTWRKCVKWFKPDTSIVVIVFAHGITHGKNAREQLAIHDSVDNTKCNRIRCICLNSLRLRRSGIVYDKIGLKRAHRLTTLSLVHLALFVRELNRWLPFLGSTLNAMAGERSRVRVPPCGMRCH